jgi:hypothetical protein
MPWPIGHVIWRRAFSRLLEGSRSIDGRHSTHRQVGKLVVRWNAQFNEVPDQRIQRLTVARLKLRQNPFAILFCQGV